MVNTAYELQQQGIKVLSITEQIDTATATGRMMFNLLSTVAEYFLDLNRERTMAGLRAAVARGRKGGRPPKLNEADLAAGRAMLAAGDIPVAAIAKRLGVGRRTFYEYLARARSQAVKP